MRAGEGPQRPRPPARSWSTRATCTRRSSSKTPAARSSTSTTCPKRPTSKSAKARRSRPARCWPRRPAKSSGTQDITGGLPRVTEIFEARKPKDPAVMAEIAGTVELLGEKRRGKRTIIVRSESGIEREHLVSARQAPARPRRRLRPGRRGRWSTARWCRTTSCASPAKRPCSSTCSAKSRTSTAASAWRSTTSTSRSSSPRCSARCRSRPPATPTCCPAA